MTDAPPLRACDVRFTRADRLIIDGVDCTVETGSLTALVGPNGAGKSTLLHLIAAAEHPESGEIALNGTNANRMRRRERARFTALIEQQADTVTDLRVIDVVMLGRTPHVSMLGAPGADDRAIVADALARMDVSAFATRRFHELSGGERQRALVARALAQQPTLLLADEPTNHLDIRAQLHALSLLRGLADQGLGVLAALHDLTLAARYADQIIVLAGGQVVASGAPADVLTRDLIADVYGVEAHVLTHPVDGTPVIAFSERPSVASTMDAASRPRLTRHPQDGKTPVGSGV